MLPLRLPDMLFANAGVPVFLIGFTYAPLLLLPIIAIEAIVYALLLQQRWRTLVGIVAFVNIFSTLIGYGLVAALMFALETVVPGGMEMVDLKTWQERLFAATIQAAWLPPYEGHLKWLFPTACLTLLAPTYLVTVLMEGRLLREFVPGASPRQVWRACWLANTASYGAIALYLMWLLVVNRK